MESRAHALTAGVFTVALAAALVAVVVWFGDRGRGPRDVYVIVSKSSVSGLNEQASVRYRGVDVGRVTEIRFDPADPQAILVRIAVDPQTHVTSETYAQLSYQGITGLAYVTLDDEGKLGQPLPEGRRDPPRIPMRPSLLQEVGDAGQLLLIRIDEIARRVNLVLNEENRARIGRTIENVEKTTARFVAVQEKLIPTLEELPGLTREARGTMQRSEELLGEMATLTREAREKLDALEAVENNAQRVGVAADAFYDSTLPSLNRLLERLGRSAENLDRVLRAQSDQPGSLIFGAAPPEPGPGEPGYRGSSGGSRRE
jgi:phospholipid/cholesterol/gamma-HCH transport system substrate-binding protein